MDGRTDKGVKMKTLKSKFYQDLEDAVHYKIKHGKMTKEEGRVILEEWQLTDQVDWLSQLQEKEIKYGSN